MLRELGALVRERTVTAVALVEHAYERVAQLNGPLNAVVALRDVREALAEAAALDERVAAGRRGGPLAGVPFLVKDDQDLAGLPTTQGSLLRADAPRPGATVSAWCGCAPPAPYPSARPTCRSSASRGSRRTACTARP